ncbi:cysteine--tRNA ligase [Candidatus Bipolaricaulota bacterium]|nr:cysteine--tRNA ligase [Candidatus Bipolaricaulota bacterium]
MRLYNTLTRKLEELSVHGNTVRMYVCGPTVYDFIHIGNARPLIVFDALRRCLEEQGYTVHYVQNITDVDDKIIRRAQQEGTSPEVLAERFAREYLEDLRALDVKEPTFSPRARGYVNQMIEVIEDLIAKGYAYVVDGDVYFSVGSFPDYGKLSGRVREEQEAGARVEVDERKRDPLDFALWKAAKPGEPKWPSPWGKGRPGWHTECVTMVLTLLGETVDIHAGGSDLIFPHHENELAQAEALTGKPLARIWLHNGMLTVEGEKMAKSLGNFAYVRGLVKRADGTGIYSPEAVRYFYLSRHWRKPLDFSADALREAEEAVERVYNLLSQAERFPERVPPPSAEPFLSFLREQRGRFQEELSADFNTPGALGVIQGIVGEGYRFQAQGGDPAALRLAARAVRELGRALGLFQKASYSPTVGLAEELLGLLTELRGELRKERQFPLADRIRDRLGELGIELRDGPQGTTWSVRRSGDVPDPRG